MVREGASQGRSGLVGKEFPCKKYSPLLMPILNLSFTIQNDQSKASRASCALLSNMIPTLGSYARALKDLLGFARSAKAKERSSSWNWVRETQQITTNIDDNAFFLQSNTNEQICILYYGTLPLLSPPSLAGCSGQRSAQKSWCHRSCRTTRRWCRSLTGGAAFWGWSGSCAFSGVGLVRPDEAGVDDLNSALKPFGWEYGWRRRQGK